MITDDPGRHDLTPIQIILTDQNLCLSASANETAPGRVFLANCSDSSDQFFIFEKVIQNENLLESKAPKESTTTHQGEEIPRLFGITPQFHGTILSKTKEEYCLSVTDTQVLSLKLCKSITARNKFPQQKFAYYNGQLTIRGTTDCVTPDKLLTCSNSINQTAKWEYDPSLLSMSWNRQCIALIPTTIIPRLTFTTCNISDPLQQWNFQHSLAELKPMPLETIPAWKDLQKQRNRRSRDRNWPNFASSSTGRPTSTTPKLPANPPKPVSTPTASQPSSPSNQNTTNQNITKNISDSDRQILDIENRQFIEAQAAKHETVLANEIRNLYCKITAIQRNQAVIMAQSNSILTGTALNLEKCSRVSSSGITLVLQQCAVVPIQLSAKLTSCGYQPFFQAISANYTIGKDGWSLHPFQDCFWTSPYVSLNDKTYQWINDDWKLHEPSVHLTKLHLVKKFDDIPLKSYNYLPNHHSIYESNTIEQMNVLSELISRIQLSSSNSLSSLVLDTKSQSNFGDMSIWIYIFKYGLLGLLACIILFTCIYLAIACIPCHRLPAILTRKQVTVNDIELTAPLNPRLTTAKQHNHNHTIIDPIKGLCWNDGCVIVPPSAPAL
jgi:hypothetical protein